MDREHAGHPHPHRRELHCVALRHHERKLQGKAIRIALNATSVVITSAHGDGAGPPFASWSIDGEPRYEVQYALRNGLSFLGSR
jgi:hypothetical protein